MQSTMPTPAVEPPCSRCHKQFAPFVGEALALTFASHAACGGSRGRSGLAQARKNQSVVAALTGPPRQCVSGPGILLPESFRQEPSNTEYASVLPGVTFPVHIIQCRILRTLPARGTVVLFELWGLLLAHGPVPEAGLLYRGLGYKTGPERFLQGL
ncbi:uncharacterized protein PG986_014483 [Apiospora aurea]|uniref:Uncharacterized protein n=1 Tax=Apiospora aurea TaxID=335848 RepID=A0ABR1PTM8_9PEZI